MKGCTLPHFKYFSIRLCKYFKSGIANLIHVVVYHWIYLNPLSIQMSYYIRQMMLIILFFFLLIIDRNIFHRPSDLYAEYAYTFF